MGVGVQSREGVTEAVALWGGGECGVGVSVCVGGGT